MLGTRPRETSTQKTERESLALSKYEKALKIWSHYTSDTDLNSFVAIGSLYQALARFRGLASTAVNMQKHYDLAITNFQLALDKALTDHESIHILYLLFSIYRSLMLSKGKEEIKQYGPQCRYYAELSLNKMVKVYLENDMRTAQLFEELGTICSFHLGDHDAALAYNKEALAIKLRNPNQSPWMLYTNISSHYFSRKNYPEALRFQLLNHEDILNRFALKATDNDATRREKRYMIARSYMTVGDYYTPLDRQLSLQYLQMAKNLYQELEHPSSATEIEKIEKKIEALCT
ncbi:unnamed protein product [Adineta ricciae]|uniref:Uncharacterized protein n=1 Tax=Adineta ricciae TaxID=249248 RepID=A0A815TCX2_ADIRI|nr:unnamed protein product [Adineta ricciae]